VVQRVTVALRLARAATTWRVCAVFTHFTGMFDKLCTVFKKERIAYTCINGSMNRMQRWVCAVSHC
jgi:hypothetical protein